MPLAKLTKVDPELTDRPGSSDHLLQTTLLFRLAKRTAVNPWQVVAIWAVLLVGAFISAGSFTSNLTGSSNLIPGSDSERAQTLIDEEFGGVPAEIDFAVIHSETLTSDDEDFVAAVEAAMAAYGTSDLVVDVVSPYEAPDRLISPDGATALLPVSLDGDDAELQELAGPLQGLAQDLTGDAIEVYFTGAAPLAAAGVEQGTADLARADSIGIPAAAAVLVVAFGSLVAAGIPLVLGGVAVLAAFGALGIVSLFMPFDVFVQTAVSMVSIAIGIDYSLFIVTRFREELSAVANDSREERVDAVARTIATAGHAVVFSGTTTVVSLTGLLLVRSPRVDSMAYGMITAVLVMMVLAVTLLPALLSLLGNRVNGLALPWARRALTDPDPDHSIWAKVVNIVMRRPLLIAVTVVAFLGATSMPAFGLRYGVDLGAASVAESPAGRGYEIVSGSFAPGVLTPVEVVVTSGDAPFSDAQLDAVARFTETMASRDDVVEVVSITQVLDEAVGAHSAQVLGLAMNSDAGQLSEIVNDELTASVVTVRPLLGADTGQTADLVRQTREVGDELLVPAGLTAVVGGSPAAIVDVIDESTRAMPLVISAVLGASLILLLFAFRSLLLPIKAVIMNLGTSGIAFGLAVVVFQDGHGADLFGVERTGFIQAILPLFAFALVFGLSMDYEVFMLSRMREEWERTGDNAQAVRLGITRTARVITAAAAIMVVVFGSFMFTQVLEIKQMGFMLGLAVLADATIVRLLLVPSLMKLMGSWNWWLPGWLDRVLPRIATGRH